MKVTLEQRMEAVFDRKALNLRQLKEVSGRGRQKQRFRVEKIAELSTEDFALISTRLDNYYRFLYESRESMYFDAGDQCFHCILITTAERKEGILAEAEGYAYVRYGAYIPDCRKLDLRQAEVMKEVTLSHDIPEEYWRTGERQKTGKGQER